MSNVVPAANLPSIEQLKKDLRFYRDRALQLQKELNKVGAIRAEIFRLKESLPSFPKWMTEHRATAHQRIPVPLLFTSDFQWGEVVDKKEVNGVNGYNVEVAKRRYRELINATIDICYNYETRTNYPGIILCRGGDTISGDIHEELRDTNELTSIMQVYSVLCEEKNGIDNLLKKFKKVVVLSVAGNHGRTSEKPKSKKYSEANYDYLISLLLEKLYEGNPNVVFYTPVSGDAYFKVYNTHFLLTHGDRIGSSGGQGFIGPAATIMRGVKKTRDMYSEIGKPVDYCLIGHFHVAMHLPHCIVNGSLSGYSEYAMRYRMEPEPPSQTLLFIDPKWGIEQRRIITLEQPKGKGHGNWFLPSKALYEETP